jgi:hypothetical protein
LPEVSWLFFKARTKTHILGAPNVRGHTKPDRSYDYLRHSKILPHLKHQPRTRYRQCDRRIFQKTVGVLCVFAVNFPLCLLLSFSSRLE